MKQYLDLESIASDSFDDELNKIAALSSGPIGPQGVSHALGRLNRMIGEIATETGRSYKSVGKALKQTVLGGVEAGKAGVSSISGKLAKSKADKMSYFRHPIKKFKLRGAQAGHELNAEDALEMLGVRKKLLARNLQRSGLAVVTGGAGIGAYKATHRKKD